uniref:Uncharacterized protein n=1 Tax=Haemonchus placei TaxID=6290 RepID=A0A0N4WJE7_HAEPC
LSGTLRKRLIPRSENRERAAKGRHHKVPQESQLSVALVEVGIQNAPKPMI